MAEKQEYGGHDFEFVGAVSDRLNCNICTKVLCDPHLAVCCGQHFCESCLNKWFTRQGKESCPHCRATGEDFHHVINKGVRSEINQLKIRCSNHGEGCQWTGELGALKKHLGSDNGCDFVLVECPNKCKGLHWDPLLCGDIEEVSLMKRKDLFYHLTHLCYLRPYQCKFCGVQDTYQAITGDSSYWFRNKLTNENPYFGHQASCPEAPLTCPNKCASKGIKRKDMGSHRSQCPQEPMECPFAEAGCKVDVRRHQLEDHTTTSLQQHVMLVMIDRKHLKGELNEMKAKLQKAETKLNETELKLRKTETELGEVKCKLSEAETEIDETKRELFEVKAHLTTELGVDFTTKKLEKRGDSVKLTMYSFSQYRRSGKVWHSLPFYYREGYKMCLAVYANGVGLGAGTHVSVALVHLEGEHDDKLNWPTKPCGNFHFKFQYPEGHDLFPVCQALQRLQVNKYKEICCLHRFCGLNSEALHLVNDCLSFNVKYYDGCYLEVKI